MIGLTLDPHLAEEVSVAIPVEDNLAFGGRATDLLLASPWLKRAGRTPYGEDVFLWIAQEVGAGSKVGRPDFEREGYVYRNPH